MVCLLCKRASPAGGLGWLETLDQVFWRSCQWRSAGPCAKRERIHEVYEGILARCGVPDFPRVTIDHPCEQNADGGNPCPRYHTAGQEGSRIFDRFDFIPFFMGSWKRMLRKSQLLRLWHWDVSRDPDSVEFCHIPRGEGN